MDINKDNAKFNIWTGVVSNINRDIDYNNDEDELLPPHFYYVEDRQKPVYDMDGKYIGMLYMGTFLNIDTMYDLWGHIYGVECRHCDHICAYDDEFVSNVPVCRCCQMEKKLSLSIR